MKANWSLYEILCTTKVIPEYLITIEDPFQLFSDQLKQMADHTIPKSSANLHMRKQWFNNEQTNKHWSIGRKMTSYSL